MTSAAADKKSTRKWIFLIVFPFVGLLAVALLQFAVNFIFSTTADSSLTAAGSDNAVAVVVNIISILVGVLAMIGIVLLPVWIIMLVKASNYNKATPDKRLNKTVAIVFAVLFGFFSWLYTYERDSAKFWVNLVLSIVTLGLWAIIGWIWAIIDMTSKSSDYYNYYPERSS
jgi:hypothetical protein